MTPSVDAAQSSACCSVIVESAKLAASPAVGAENTIRSRRKREHGRDVLDGEPARQPAEEPDEKGDEGDDGADEEESPLGEAKIA